MNLSQMLRTSYGASADIEQLPSYHTIVYSTRDVDNRLVMELNDNFSTPFIESGNGEQIRIAVKSLMSENNKYGVAISLQNIFVNFTAMSEGNAKKFANFLTRLYEHFAYDSFDMEIGDKVRLVFVNVNKG